MSELRCHGNLLTSPKTAPLCSRQVLVVRMSIIQISDRGTSFFNNIQVFMGHFLIIRHDLSLPYCIHSESRISLRFFSGDLSLPCGIALTMIKVLIQVWES